MRLLKNRSTVFYLTFFLILTMAIGGVAIGAFAAGPTATASLTAGTLTESDTFSPTFPSKKLTGQDQLITVTGGLSMQVTDATGSGDGWITTIAGTAFNCTSGACKGDVSKGITGQSVLDPTDQNANPQTGPLYLTSESAQCTGGTGNTCTPPTPSTPSTVYMQSTPTPFYTDNVNAGMGISTVSADINLIVPGNTYAGTYQSTVSLAVQTGP